MAKNFRLNTFVLLPFQQNKKDAKKAPSPHRRSQGSADSVSQTGPRPVPTPQTGRQSQQDRPQRPQNSSQETTGHKNTLHQKAATPSSKPPATRLTGRTSPQDIKQQGMRSQTAMNKQNSPRKSRISPANTVSPPKKRKTNREEEMDIETAEDGEVPRPPETHPYQGYCILL